MEKNIILQWEARKSTLPGAGLIYMGIGFVLMALGTIFGKMAAWFFKDCIPGIANAIADGLGKIFRPRGV